MESCMLRQIWRIKMITLLADADGYIVIKAHEEGVYKGEERKSICCSLIYFILELKGDIYG